MIRCFLSALGLALIAIVATVIWYEGVSLPFVGQVINGEVAGRLEGYVALSEKVATDAKLAEIKRQAEASKAATEEYRKRMLAAQDQERKAEANLQSVVAAIRSKKASSCKLTPQDIQLLNGFKF